VKTDEFLHFEEPCPYVSGRLSSGDLMLGWKWFDQYESLIPYGWRRAGDILYRYRCEGCSSCIPIRLSATGYPSSGSRAKRLKRLNGDIVLTISDATYKEEHFRLYDNYIRMRHGGSGASMEESYKGLLSSPMAAVSEYRDSGGNLVGIGFLDVLPFGLSSVYFAFDPAEAKRSLGSYSIYAESELSLRMGKKYYYLGFWVPHAMKMDYKADFPPFQLAFPRMLAGEENVKSLVWEEFRSKADALKRLAALPHR
jgi:arginine-tRNA-protein transferase